MRRARHRRPAALAILAAGLALAAVPSAATAAGPPAIGAAWSTEVAATSARLHAEVNPNGFATTYHFNYITEAAYQANISEGREPFFGAAKAPAGADPSIGSGTAAVAVLQTIGALAPETTYRYRILAHSAEGTVEALRAFTTQGFGGAARLLDKRGWEMVSPVDKNGGQVQGAGQTFGGGVLQAAASGEAATYSSSASFGEGAQGAPPASQYISRRGEAGWMTENITTPTPSGSYGDHPDGVPYQLFSEDLARGLLLDGRRCAEGEECPRGYSLRDNESGAFTDSPEEPDLHFAGSSADLRHIVLSTCAALTPDATEVAGSEGCDPSEPNLYDWSGGGLTLLNLLPGQSEGTPGARLAAQGGAVSADGSRVYFSESEDGALYLREAGGPTKLLPETVGGGAAFQAASADGRIAFFTKGGTLYRYSEASEASAPIASEVLGVLGASEDGSAVYYQAAGGLFLWGEGATTEEIVPGAAAAQPSDWPPTTGTARVSADGAHLAFLSKAPLSGYENTDQTTGKPDTEVYLYDAEAHELTCASCNPTGERPAGPSTIPGAIANGEGEAATDSYKPRVLSADGARLFFDSEDALVLSDTNKAPDVYEWEAGGQGSCTKPGGCLALISSGRSTEGASFVDASAGGGDAFFLTDGSLVSQDPGSFDLYDAREGGGFPAAERPIECEGDACQPLVPEPEDPDPGTLLPGAGNPPLRYPKAHKCKKGFVRRHGRCVRRVHHRGHHHKRGLR
jgi:hypothetical protein